MPENGLALLVNEDNLVALSPPRPLVQFFYRCDRRFHIDSLFPLYESHDRYGVVLISGHNCLFYLVETSPVLIGKMEVSLQSRQKKGGQSALRIARLAEEKRHVYLKAVVERFNNLYLTEDKAEPRVKGLLIAGPAEMKVQLAQSDLIDYRLRSLIISPLLTIDEIRDDTIHDVLSKAPWDREIRSKEESLCHGIIESIERGEDRYVYGPEAISRYLSLGNCKCLYVHKKVSFTPEEGIISIHIISEGKTGLKFLQGYGGIILEPYYILPPLDYVV